MARTALVTGGTRGIGKAIAIALKQAGCKVAANYAGNDEAAAAFKAETGIEVFKWSVADYDACKAGIEAVEAELGPIDILINNAGITRDGLLFRMSDDDWNAVLQTNLTSCFTWSKAIVRPMTRKRWGRVLNITSITGRAGNAGQTNYAAAKAGMVGFTMSLAREVASRNVTVNALAPGFIETDMTGSLSEEIQSAVKGQIPLKRFGGAQEIADLTAFLVSERAAYITGQTFSVDGGMYISA